ncbi:chorismate mutase 2 [Andrographis paniculata]|uniref:chorismate mutase 2 n=1 Tax=Andrographis paniculata TaxID=175694 RepID=UPI0021E9A8E2|nr:chorismate mutase 2 [Andrographis paniculata]
MAQGDYADSLLNLESVRKSLIRQEDTIIFSLIERAKYPLNLPLYDGDLLGCNSSRSLFEFFVKESEALQAKAGRYLWPEENAFFPDNLPTSLLPPLNQPPVLHPRSATININEKIKKLYLDSLLPLIAAEGDDRNYAVTAASDLNCLQAISQRIHFGKFVAEVKFRDDPEDYIPAIRAKDKETLMKLLTFESVEEMVKKRVEKKAKIFGQDVGVEDHSSSSSSYKVDPSAVRKLYADWVIPLTKLVEVEYLLQRLD